MAKSDYDIEKLSKAYSNVNILETKVSSIIDDIRFIDSCNIGIYLSSIHIPAASLNEPYVDLIIVWK